MEKVGKSDTNANPVCIFQYYLVDDTLEIRECHQANDGRDPFPVLIGRHRVPKDRYNVPSSFPAVVMELSNNEIKEYFTPKDFMIGQTVTLYGRRFLVYDCDNFTKAFYYHNFGITEFPKVDVNGDGKDLPKMVGSDVWVMSMLILSISLVMPMLI